MHRNYVGACERGEINLSFRVLLQFAEGLAVSLSEIVVHYERILRAGTHSVPDDKSPTGSPGRRSHAPP